MERKYRILIVDDEAEHSANIRDILEMNGYAVNTAGSGKEAIIICQKVSYDLALVDIRLPDISGNKVVNEMSMISPSTEYIYITGYASIDSAIEAAKQEHVISYETKPINMDHLLPIIKQITVRKQAEEELQASEEQKRQLLNSLKEGVYQCELGVEGTFTWVNQAGAEIFGYKSPEEMIGTKVEDIYVDLEDRRKLVEKLAKNGVWRNFVSFCKKKNGERFYTERTTNMVKDARGKPVRIEGIIRDITERRQAEEKFKHLAFHDPLTDLPNRMLFSDRLNLAIAHAHRKKERLAVLFLDLDKFKVINDTVGHALGDQLLQDIADRLKNCIRGGDTISRFGGDEFNLLLPGINHVEDVHNITCKIINTLKKPLVIVNCEFY
ncbi:MAG: diguanylate cyclase, partial [Candidatus Scalindua sp.]